MEEKYVEMIEKLSGSYSPWQIWMDLVNMMFLSIANSCNKEGRDRREQEYLAIIKKYPKQNLEKFVTMTGMIIMDLEADPNQDLLGAIYMRLNMGSKASSQYFTPYYISKMMAQMVLKDNHKVEMVYEPACGAGCTLIALANTMRENGLNYQREVYFVAQDIDGFVAKMCYIQMSLLAMPGVVIIGDSLKASTEGMEHLYTPFHFVFGQHIFVKLRKRHENGEKIILTSDDMDSSPEENSWLLELVGVG